VTFKPGKVMEERVRRLSEAPEKVVPVQQDTEPGENGSEEHGEPVIAGKIGKVRKSP
jgi:hypothetical protein